jgi:hypothetical protein
LLSTYLLTELLLLACFSFIAKVLSVCPAKQSNFRFEVCQHSQSFYALKNMSFAPSFHSAAAASFADALADAYVLNHLCNVHFMFAHQTGIIYVHFE